MGAYVLMETGSLYNFLLLAILFTPLYNAPSLQADKCQRTWRKKTRVFLNLSTSFGRLKSRPPDAGLWGLQLTFGRE